MNDQVAQFVGTQPTGAHEVTYPFSLEPGQQLQVSAAKKARHYFIIQNHTAEILCWSVGRPATASDFKLYGVGDYYEAQNPPRGSINIFSENGGSGVVIEG